MTDFDWVYKGNGHPLLKTFLLHQGFTQLLLKKVKFHGGQIFVNDDYQFTNYILSNGDKIHLVLPKEPSNPNVSISNKPIDIVYEDKNFLVVNKSAKIPSVPSHRRHNDTLINRVKGYYIRNKYDNLQMHIVTRLDSNTSGLVLFAKNHLAHSILDRQLKEGRIKKQYLAIVQGELKKQSGSIYAPIGRKPPSIVERMVREDGRDAYTTFKVIKNLKGMSLVNVRLHTGRTHQIRVHFKYINHPLVGDWLYNPNNHAMNRQALHCKKISFYNPFKHQTITCNAKEPYDIERLIKKFNKENEYG